MRKISRTFAAAALVAAALAVSSAALAEPIVGKWKTADGESAAIGGCGAAFCIKLITGEYAGKRIGRLKGKGGAYKGTITDPRDGKKYSGSAKVSGSSLILRGCALKVFCKTQSWKRL